MMKVFRLLTLVLCMGVMMPLEAVRYQHIVVHNAESGLTQKAVSVFQRIVKEKAGQDLFAAPGKTLTIHLATAQDLGPEAYRIGLTGRNSLTIEGGDDHGVMYGLGKVLHTAYISPRGFELGECTGSSAPEKRIRGIYLATHFHNFYNDAPIETVAAYIEELALWGYNALQVWFDMHHYTGINDPKAVAMTARLKQLLAAGRAVGMKSGLTMLANESYNNTPKALRSERINWTGFYGCEICPSKPGGTALILQQREEMLKVFGNMGLEIDYIWLWPYDQGGCSCEDCRPWGANGFLKLTKRLAALIHELLPRTRLVLSTWLFDFEEQDKGEWKGLTKAFEAEKPWVDYIMADSHTKYPRYLLSHPVPGGLPLLNFPEISMWENYPWGGYGANPLPLRFEKLWREIAHLTSGGYPYSEGKFEDFNKVLYSQFYWQADRPAADILREYVCHEFSRRHADDIMEAIYIMEKNMGLKTVNWDTHKEAPKVIKVPETDFGAQRAWNILQRVDKKLTPQVQASWRWRIIYLRGYLDWALRASHGEVTTDINRAFKELLDISCLNEGANFVVRPPYIPGR